MKRQFQPLVQVYVAVWILCGPAAAAVHEVTVKGEFLTGHASSNGEGASVLGIPKGTKLAGIPVTIVFTIDDAWGEQSKPHPTLRSQITTATKAPTRLVTAIVTLHGANPQQDGRFDVGGQFPPFNWRPIVSRGIDLQGTKVVRSAVKVWTSERNVPYTAGGLAAFDCLSPLTAPFTQDVRWHAPFEYEPTDPKYAHSCATDISYYRKSEDGIWRMLEGRVRADSVVMTTLSATPHPQVERP